MRKNVLFSVLILLVSFLFSGFVFVNAECGAVNTCSSDFDLCTSGGNVSCENGCNSTTNLCDGRVYLDSLDRITFIDYLDNYFDRNYTYYENTSNVHNLNVGNSGESYEYDEYGNLIGEFYGSYDEDLIYSYNLLSEDMPLSTVFGGGGVVKFGYFSGGNLQSDSVIVDGKKFAVKYEYDANDCISKIVNLKTKYTFINNEDCLVLREETLTMINGNEYQEKSGGNYTYNSYGQPTSFLDDLGTQPTWSYQNITFACLESSINDSFVDSECTYSKLSGKKVNNYTVNVSSGDIESYNTSTGGLFTPNVTLDDNGYVISDDIYEYSFGDNYSELDKILADGFGEDSSDLVMDFSYSEDGELVSTDYISELGSVQESLGYDPLNRIAYKELTSDGSSTITAAVIKNLFTGFALLGGAEPVRIYYASAGDSSSGITAEEYNELIKPENIWPELAEEYKGSENSDWLKYFCQDLDAGENETVIFGAVDFDLTGREYDYCQDNVNLVENYCGNATFQSLDFWTVKTVPKTFVQVCQYGCSEGRCLTAEDLQCLVDADCGANMKCINSTCVFIGAVPDLPPEPSLPTEELA